MTDHTELHEKIMRTMCREDTAFMGEPPCFEIEGDWPNPNCACKAASNAIMDLIGPKDLVWGIDKDQFRAKTESGQYFIDFDGYEISLEHDLYFGSIDIDSDATESAAKSAAQAHYDRLWWEGMK